MNETTDSFKEFAAVFKHENPDVLASWQKSSDPLRRAVAQILEEACGVSL
jgi:hypothetical protein